MNTTRVVSTPPPAARDTATSSAKALTAALTKAVTLPTGRLTSTSETDYQVDVVSHALPADGKVTTAFMLKAFAPEIAEVMDDGGTDMNALGARVSDDKQTRADLKRYQTPVQDDAEWLAWSNVSGLLQKELSDLQTFKVGVKGSDGKVEENAGAYIYFIVGRTADNELAGISYGSVET